MRKFTNRIVGICFFMLVGSILLLSARALAMNLDDQPTQQVQIPEQVIITDDDPEEFLNARNAFAVEVHDYITRVAPHADVDPYVLIDLCTEYNIDVAFVLAQGQIESHFATKGTARRTNSIFNVGAYDGHSANRQCRNGFGFEDPNDSIEPYLMLLTSDYLVNGKTINDLMKNYVNKLGMRYASNPKYESQLRSVYNRIYRNPRFKTAYEEYKNRYSEIG